MKIITPDAPAPDAPPPQTTLVRLTWQQGQIEHWIRFGRPVYEYRKDAYHRTVGFASGSIFAFVRWASNGYGTVVSRIDILRAPRYGEAVQSVPFVVPGGQILLKCTGWPKVERVLQKIDTIEGLLIAPEDVAPDYWQHVHNRLMVGQVPRDYSRAQHLAWRKRQRSAP